MMSCCILIVKLSLFAQLFLMYFVRQKNRDSNEKVKEDLAKTDAKKLFEVCFCFDLFFSYFVSLSFYVLTHISILLFLHFQAFCYIDKMTLFGRRFTLLCDSSRKLRSTSKHSVLVDHQRKKIRNRNRTWMVACWYSLLVDFFSFFSGRARQKGNRQSSICRSPYKQKLCTTASHLRRLQNCKFPWVI